MMRTDYLPYLLALALLSLLHVAAAAGESRAQPAGNARIVQMGMVHAHQGKVILLKVVCVVTAGVGDVGRAFDEIAVAFDDFGWIVHSLSCLL